MSDLLEKFRPKGAAVPAAEKPPVDESAGYLAFRAVDRQPLRLKIRPARRAWERVSYNYLLRIMENGTFGTELTLIFTFMVVEITGRNLTIIADAIDRQQCDEIREFDPDYWTLPADKAAPFISSIKIHVKRLDEETARANEEMNGRFTPTVGGGLDAETCSA